jgi:Skp family chaperone for outer membrane proteins
MRRVVVAVPLALLMGVVSAFAQAPAQPAAPPPAGQAPAQPPAGQAPAQPAPKPTQPPAAKPTPPPAAAQQPAPKPPPPFPQGAKVAFVNLQGVFQLSADGKAAAAKVQSMTTQKQAQIAERQKVLQANQQKLQTGGTVMSDSARLALEKDIDKQTRELERFQQDAQAELTELQTDLNDTFQRRLFPILEKMAQDKELQMLFSATDAGLIWAEPGLDLTFEAVKLLDTAPTK